MACYYAPKKPKRARGQGFNYKQAGVFFQNNFPGKGHLIWEKAPRKWFQINGKRES